MTYYLPTYEIAGNTGFNQAKVDRYIEVIRSTAHFNLEFVQEGVFEHATNF